jgi:HK97 family phage major capsid protein
MSDALTVSGYVEKARAAIAAGNLDEAETYTQQAKAVKALADLEPKVDPAARLPFGEPVAEKTENTTAMAVKSIYIKQHKNLDETTDQIYRELYGTDNYPALLAAKMADVNRYMRTNRVDPRFEKMVLLSPGQIMAAVMNGVPVAEGTYSIKATMVEAQDTLGGVLVPEEINQDMVQRLVGLTVVRPRARKFNTSRDALSFLVRTGGTKRFIGAVRSKMTSESPSSGSFNTNATFGKINIPVHVNLSKVPVSKSLLEDSSMDILSQVLMPEFATEAAIKEDGQFLTGTGADEPQGILGPLNTSGPQNSDTVDATAARPARSPSTRWSACRGASPGSTAPSATPQRRGRSPAPPAR